MGMFDTVYLRCPNCQTPVRFQSKAGDCSLNSYSQDSVPTEIAHDVKDDVEQCRRCGLTVRACTESDPPRTVKMFAVADEETPK